MAAASTNARRAGVPRTGTSPEPSRSADIASVTVSSTVASSPGSSTVDRLPSMEGPSATTALVLAQAAVGGTALLWLGGLWGSVKRGFFVLTGASVLALALLATLAAAS